MKKLIIYSAACLIAAILFSSCSSYVTITKRHYNSGYYLDYSTNKQLTSVSKEKAVQPRITSPMYSVQSTSENIVRVSGSSQTQKIANTSNPVVGERKENKTIVHGNNKTLVQKSSPEIIGIPVEQMKQTPSVISNVTDDDHPNRRDVLSFFWIVILIVLILWLVGILTGSFGIGGFVNLLLVIAVILLILWLLRII